MNLSNWIRFRWDLTQLPNFEADLPEHYEIGSATAEDETELRKIISTSFVLDPPGTPHPGSHGDDRTLARRAFASPTGTASR